MSVQTYAFLTRYSAKEIFQSKINKNNLINTNEAF